MVERKLGRIEYGTVIDHITAGRAIDVLNVLEIPREKTTISLLINTDSKKMKKKDVIKIEGEHLNPREIAKKIESIAPKATVNWIENSKVVSKVKIAFL